MGWEVLQQDFGGASLLSRGHRLLSSCTAAEGPGKPDRSDTSR